jgi:hypothetical protein
MPFQQAMTMRVRLHRHFEVHLNQPVRNNRGAQSISKSSSATKDDRCGVGSLLVSLGEKGGVTSAARVWFQHKAGILAHFHSFTNQQ